LGAQALASCLSQAEAAAKGVAELVDIEDMLATADVLLQQACKVMLELADALAPAAASGASSIGANAEDKDQGLVIDAELSAKLDELAALLKDSNMRALDLFAELNAFFTAQSDAAADVQNAMAGLDFSGAYAALCKLREHEA